MSDEKPLHVRVAEALGCRVEKAERPFDDPRKPEDDPERALWVPGRRRFLFLGAAAMASSLVAPTFQDVLAVTTPSPAMATAVPLPTMQALMESLARTYSRDLYIRPLMSEKPDFTAVRR